MVEYIQVIQEFLATWLTYELDFKPTVDVYYNLIESYPQLLTLSVLFPLQDLVYT